MCRIMITVYTDVKGEFESDKAHTFSIGSQEVLFHDVDGEENGGEFESVTLGVDQMEKSQIKKRRKLVYGSL